MSLVQRQAIHEYDIEGDEEAAIGTNCYNARIRYEGSQRWIEVSVLRYATLQEAEKQQAYSLAIGPIMANPIEICNDHNSRCPSFWLFVERLYPLVDKDGNVFVFKEPQFEGSKFQKGQFIKDKDMWKIVDGVCIGLSNRHRSIVRQIALGLLAIHCRGYCHGNPGSYIMYGADGRVRLYNLDVNIIYCAKNKKEDFDSFMRFLLGFIKLMPLCAEVAPLELTHRGLHVPHDVKDYFDLISNFKLWNSDNVKWLYNPPVIWDTNQKTRFVNIMSSIMKANFTFATDNFMLLEIGDNWVAERIDVIDHESVIFKAYCKDRGNTTFNYAWGSLVFVRNTLEHCQLDTITFDRLEVMFPELISVTYRDLIAATISKVYDKKYDNFLVDDSNTPISLEEFLWREPSIFRSF